MAYKPKFEALVRLRCIDRDRVQRKNGLRSDFVWNIYVKLALKWFIASNWNGQKVILTGRIINSLNERELKMRGLSKMTLCRLKAQKPGPKAALRAKSVAIGHFFLRIWLYNYISLKKQLLNKKRIVKNLEVECCLWKSKDIRIKSRS